MAAVRDNDLSIAERVARGVTSRASTLAEAVHLHGRDTVAFQALAPGMRAWTDGAGAWVAHVDTGEAWISVGSPLCAPEDVGRVARGFVKSAREAGRRAGFCAVEDFPRDAFFARVPLGQQPIWDPRQWERILAGRRRLREQIRRAYAKGVRARVVPKEEIEGPLRPSIAALSTHWLERRRGGPLGFLLAVELFYRPSERLYIVAERGAEVVALLAAVPVPGRGGWYLEDILRTDVAPNGTVEMLVDVAMRRLADEGSGRVTMGLVPLTGPLPPALRMLRRIGRRFYDFDGLHAFRSRLAPQAWEPVWLTHPRSTRGLVSLWDVASALTGGHPFRFARRAWLGVHRRPHDARSSGMPAGGVSGGASTESSPSTSST